MLKKNLLSRTVPFWKHQPLLPCLCLKVNDGDLVPVDAIRFSRTVPLPVGNSRIIIRHNTGGFDRLGIKVIDQQLVL